MKKLLKYLSPFAPDQSGACGVLYELGGIIVICDAGGCAGNVCGFDEPRWFTKKSAVFSAGLRDMDAIMGRDDRLIEKMASAQENIHSDFTAVVGTPVPAVIATDMKAIKKMAETRIGVPCITVSCTGTRYYDEGEEEAWYELFKEFAGKTEDIENAETAPEPTEEKEIVSGTETDSSRDNKSLRIGVIGATPLETGYSTLEPLIKSCEQNNYKNVVIYSVGTGLKEIAEAPLCDKNLVVSYQGLKAAKYLEERFGVPYEVGFPFVPDAVVSAVVSKMRPEEKRILIIHSQFAANELRETIRHFKGIDASSSDIKIDCATFFMQGDEYKEADDFRFQNEDELYELAAEERYDLIIGDSDIKPLLKAAGYRGGFIDYPHFAVSGRMNDDSVLIYT